MCLRTYVSTQIKHNHELRWQKIMSVKHINTQLCSDFSKKIIKKKKKKKLKQKQNKTVGLMFPGNGVYCFVEKKGYRYDPLSIQTNIY